MPTSNINKILITGGTGLIGNELTKLFISKGIHVNILSRSEKPNTETISYYKWNPNKGEMDEESLVGVDGIINLAGTSLADGRWTESRKEDILNSRINALRTLEATLRTSNQRLKFFISASAIGFYGLKDEKIYTEEDSPGEGFLADVTKKWEESAKGIKDLCDQFVYYRIGIVLSSNGGALPQLVTPIKYFVGAPLGSGKQPMPWIHIKDLCSLMYYLIENQHSGVFNAVSDNSTNKQITQLIAKHLGKPLWLPNVPSFVLKILLGEMSDMVLQGSRVSGDKVFSLGYNPQFKDLNSAIEDLI